MSVSEVAGGGDGERKDHLLCLRPVYTRSLSGFPFLETFHEARVGLDTGSVPLHKGKRELVCHPMVFYEIGDDDRSAARDTLERERERG